MGAENSKLKQKNKNDSEVIKPSRKNIKHKTTIGTDVLKGSNILDKAHIENVKLDNPNGTKTLNLNENPPEDEMDKLQREKLNCLKSFSCQNLIKLEKKNECEEVLADSFDTNCSSKSKEDYNKILNEELYNDIEDNNSLDDEDNDNNEDVENENDENAEEKKQKKLAVTNNMKTVFINSKINSFNKEHNDTPNDNIPNDIPNEDTGRLSTSSLTTFDYELNFYRNGNDIRQSYLTKLISTRVWNPNIKPKQHNSIIIFDWDDTLLPTTFLTPGGIFNEDIRISENDQEKLMEIEISVLKLLTESVEKGNVYIITNAGKGWVEYSANKFYPSILPILEKIKIISARGEYEKIFPGNSRQWKIEAFLNLQQYVDMKLVTNIICIGDSLFEMEAGRILASKFTEAFIKTIKFREAPKLDELLKQLKLVCAQFGSIYSSIKNLTIRVERKKKEEK